LSTGFGRWTAGSTSSALPEARRQRPSTYRPTYDKGRGRAMRIVIAEDAAVIRAGLVEILTDGSTKS
jgi:hypothetical protein